MSETLLIESFTNHFAFKNTVAGLLWLLILPSQLAIAQITQNKYYNRDQFETSLDSLRLIHDSSVRSKNQRHELATLLALGHYPELNGHKIRIKYKKNVKHPITASYAFSNIFKRRKKHTYVLLIKPGSFVDRIDLNKKVSLIGHELAHFVYYSERPTIGMLTWGFRYVFSKKFRYRFERDADYQAIAHGLGWQYLDMSVYISQQEVLKHMQSTNIYDLQGLFN